MKVFDLNVVRRLQLPEDAVWMIIQYLKEVHPVAVLIKALRFCRRHEGPSIIRPNYSLRRYTSTLLVYGMSQIFRRHSEKYGDRPGETRFQYSRTTGERRPYPMRYDIHRRAGDPEPPYWSDSEIASDDSGLNDGDGWHITDGWTESEEEA